MKILQSKYSISQRNYRKPTPAKLKLWADMGLLVGIAMGSDQFLNMPDFPGKEWIVWAIPWGAMIFKLITTFISEHSETN